jgi:hypothetical protein
MNPTESKSHRKRVQSRLDDWGSTIASYRTQAREISPDLRVGIQSEIDHLEARRREILERSEALAASGGEGWDEIEARCEAIDSEMQSLAPRLN